MNKWYIVYPVVVGGSLGGLVSAAFLWVYNPLAGLFYILLLIALAAYLTRNWDV